MIEIDREITQDFARAIGLEWLETNGLGGWAGTTVAGAHSRRDHGLLAVTTPPSSRRPAARSCFPDWMRPSTSRAAASS